MIDSSASTTCFSPQIGAWIEPRNDSRVDRDRSRSFSRSLSLRSIQGRTRNRSNISPLDRERSRRVLPEDQGIQGSRGSAFIPIATGAVGPVAVAAAVSLLSPTVLSALSPVPVSVPSPSAAARSCCVADDRCSCGSAGCSGSSIPACRCYRSVPCWAWCARSVYAASTALGRSGFCCKARIETHRTRRCRPTDLAAEPDTGGYFWFFGGLERQFGRRQRRVRLGSHVF